MDKKTKLNYFWFLLILIGVGFGLASFYQQAQIKHKQKFSKDFKQISENAQANEPSLYSQKITTDPANTALAKRFPKIAGFNEKKTYLVLFQNSHELRATGGYIGSFAVVSLKDGKVKNFNFHDTSNFDYQNNNKGGLEKTPAPFQKYLDITWWGLRDSNWNPHFPKTAERVIKFYQDLGGKKDIDGVVALTPKVLKRTLKITGPIKLEGEKEFRAENVVDRIQYRVEKGFLEEEGARKRRKEIMKELAQKIIEKTKSWNPLSYPKLLNSAKDAARKKEFQVYFKDKDLQQFFSRQSWTGELKSASKDYLMLVDTNLGALKTDRVIDRKLSYELDLTDPGGRARGRLEITYNHKGKTRDWRTSDYKDYLRVYLPQGTKLVGSKGLSSAPKLKTHTDKTSLEGWLQVPLGQKKTVVFEYLLPKRIDHQDYLLTIQKQAGVDEIPVKLKYHLPSQNLEQRIKLSEDKRVIF